MSTEPTDTTMPGDLVVRLNDGRAEIVRADPFILMSGDLLKSADDRYMKHDPEAGVVVVQDDFGKCFTYVLGARVSYGFGLDCDGGYWEARRQA